MMRMKFFVLSIICLFTVGFFVACSEPDGNVETEASGEGNSEDANAENTSKEVDFSNENISLSTGSESGSMYPIGVQIADFLQGNGATATNTSGNAIVNLELIEAGEADIGHSSTAVGFAAEQGTEPFERALSNVRSIAKVMESTFQFVTLEDSDISSLEEVAEQQYPLEIGVDTPGSEGELVTRMVLEEYGITYDNIEDWGGRVEFGSYGDLSSLIRDGHIEAMGVLTSVPAAAITEIDVQNPMRVLAISDEVIESVEEQFGFQRMEVAANAYEGQSEAVQTLGAGSVIFASAELDDDIVYEVTKFMNEDGRDALGSIHYQIEAYFTGPEAAASDHTTTMHSGAEKYYKEVGAID